MATQQQPLAHGKPAWGRQWLPAAALRAVVHAASASRSGAPHGCATVSTCVLPARAEDGAEWGAEGGSPCPPNSRLAVVVRPTLLLTAAAAVESGPVATRPARLFRMQWAARSALPPSRGGGAEFRWAAMLSERVANLDDDWASHSHMVGGIFFMFAQIGA